MNIQNTSRPYENVFLDLTDLLHYCTHRHTVTGIQRVTAEITNVLLQRGAHAVAFDDAAAVWMRVDTDLVLHLYATLEASSSGSGAVVAALDRIRHELNSRLDPRFIANAVLVAFGANWSSRRILGSIRAIKRQMPLTYVCFLHDVVPLKMPELCDQETARQFRRWIACTLVNADIIVTSSRINACDLARVSETSGLPPVVPICCSLDADVGPRSSSATASVGPRIGLILDQPYVLFVGTIEPRKDHLFVLAAWKFLLETLGVEQTPLLVLVGKLGWRYEPVVWALEGDHLRGRAILLSSVSDHELDRLYQSSLFTVYNSIYEGWGLPVSESLARGKVPLIPAHSALLESGETGAVFFEPGSQSDFVAKAIRLIRDPEYRRHRTEALLARRVVKTWADVAHRLLAEIAQRAAGSNRPAKAAITAGTIYRFTDDPDLQGLAVFAQSEALMESGWYALEHWGAWTSARDVVISGRLQRDVPLSARGEASGSAGAGFLATIAVLNMYDQRKLSVFQGGALPTLDTELALGRAVVQVPVTLDEELRFRLVLQQSMLTPLAGHTENWDQREIGFGAEAIMISHHSDLQARIAFLEFHAGYRISR